MVACRRQGLVEEQWFEVRLTGGDGTISAADRLRRALRPAGHEVRLLGDNDNGEFVAVRVRGPRPAQELSRLMRRAGLWGYFQPIPGLGLS